MFGGLKSKKEDAAILAQASGLARAAPAQSQGRAPGGTPSSDQRPPRQRVLPNGRISEHLMPDQADSGKLSAYNFVDLYVSGDPFTPIMARGLRAAKLGMTAHAKGLSRIPDELVDDVTALYQTIDRKWRHSNFKREFRVVHEGRSYRCALIAPPDFSYRPDEEATTRKDVRWCIRQINPVIPTFDDLNLPAMVRKDAETLMGLHGLVLISGQFASGKTTLASSMLDYWVATTRDVGVALEDPPEIPLERETEDRGVIYQIDLLDRSIRDAIKNSRRWSPRYVFLGEVRSSDVAGELLHMSISSPLVICTIHASDPVQAIMSLFRFAAGAMSEDMARDVIASCLLQVFHQELVGGRARIKSPQIWGNDNHLIRAKIKSGNFRGLHEDFERQVINRNG